MQDGPSVTGRRLRAALAGCALASVAASAQAQGLPRRSDCILDRCQDRDGAARPPAPAPDRGARRPANVAPGRFDFYVLALSWSPSFCLTTGAGRSSQQCRAGADLGFVLHGLWPQYEHGYPSDCDTRAPSQIAMQQARGLWPDEGLARYEWRKHGTCSGQSPADYFADVRRARAMVAIPDALQSPSRAQTAAPAQIQRAFLAANPRLRPGMLAVACQRGKLQEVRVCLTKDLRDFRPCPEVARDACRTPQISIPAPR
jgi:ribonuclease T2